MFFEEAATSIKEDIHGTIYAGARQLNISLPENFDDYLCPITTLMMFDPVTNQSCGHNYERTSIEGWQQQQAQNQQHEDQKEEQNCTCPCCRRPITILVSNEKLKGEIYTFLSNTKVQLAQDASDNPDNASNAHRQEIISLCDRFVTHGNHETRLKRKFDEFCRYVVNGNFNEATRASKASVVMASDSCRLL